MGWEADPAALGDFCLETVDFELLSVDFFSWPTLDPFPGVGFLIVLEPACLRTSGERSIGRKALSSAQECGSLGSSGLTWGMSHFLGLILSMGWFRAVEEIRL